MKIVIKINESELEIKKAIAKGWNFRFKDNLTYKDINNIRNKEDIFSAVPYLDYEQMKIIVGSQLVKKEGGNK